MAGVGDSEQSARPANLCDQLLGRDRVLVLEHARHPPAPIPRRPPARRTRQCRRGALRRLQPRPRPESHRHAPGPPTLHRASGAAGSGRATIPASARRPISGLLPSNRSLLRSNPRSGGATGFEVTGPLWPRLQPPLLRAAAHSRGRGTPLDAATPQRTLSRYRRTAAGHESNAPVSHSKSRGRRLTTDPERPRHLFLQA